MAASTSGNACGASKHVPKPSPADEAFAKRAADAMREALERTRKGR